MYEIRNLTFDRRRGSGRNGDCFRLEIDSFRLDPGEKVAVVGSNGSGKTSLLRILAFRERPSACELLLYKGRAIDRRNGEGIGFLRQDPWIFGGTVADNLAYPLRVRGRSREETRRRVEAMCDRLQLAGYARANPRTLSGGEQKRVALGRVLIAEPEVLLLDEPMAHLDKASRKVIEGILEEMSISTVFTTHDLHLALRLSDRTVTLRAGRICPGLLENCLEGRREEGAFVTRRGLRLVLPAGRAADAGLVAVDPSAIRLARGDDAGDAPNSFPGRVTCVRAQGETVWLDVDAGDLFAVAVSRSLYEEMRLNLHEEVVVNFSAEDVRPL